jgi:uncharacterized protein (UPF0332 family)
VISLIERATIALRSARLLLDADDPVGAANRAYFAAFDAARAVLANVAEVDVVAIRTHRGISHAFEVEIVKAGHLPRDVGKLLTLLMEMRWAADYPVAPVASDDAERAVAAAEIFVRHCRALVEPGNTP